MSTHSKSIPIDDSIRERMLQLKNRLYYITHKPEINSKRKFYKRQSWEERADNPKNKRQLPKEVKS